MSKQINVFIGNYGSGKTEISLNFALNAAKQGKKAVLVDLDIINPYFRSAEQHKLLKANGVQLIAPPYALSGVDLPVVPAEVERVFIQDYDCVVFDVGGDSVGATALGRYHARFKANEAVTNVYYVVNTRRPLSGTPEDICLMFGQIEYVSRVKITGFINNSNLSKETVPENLVEGASVLAQVSEKTGVPVKYITGEPSILEGFKTLMGDTPYQGQLMAIDTYTRPVWL